VKEVKIRPLIYTHKIIEGMSGLCTRNICTNNIVKERSYNIH